MNKKNKSFEVVVVGVDHFNTLGVIRSLGKIGCHPITIVVSEKLDDSWVLKSRYVNKDLSRVISKNTLVDNLINIAIKIGKKAYLIPVWDNAVELFDLYYDKLTPFFYMPNRFETKGQLAKMLDKPFSTSIAQSVGFSVPVTVSVEIGDQDSIQVFELLEKNEIDFPIIIKHETSTFFDKSIEVIRNFAETEQYLQKHRNGRLMIQHFVEKDEELGIQGVGFGGTKNPFIPAVIHKIRTSVDSMGSTTYAYVDSSVDEKLKKLCEDYIRKVSYSGIFDIEVLRKGEDYYFVECNFRNGAYGYAYTQLGYNLPYIWITSEIIEPRKNKRQLYLMNAFSDIKHVKLGKVSFLRWLYDFFRTRVHLTFKINDIYPFFCRILFHKRGDKI